MGLLAVVFLAVGACVLLWLFVLVLLFFFFSRDLDMLVFLCSCLQDLRCSSDEPLSELAPYADLVYLEVVVSLFIIVLRKEMELATERPVVAFGAGASLRALTLSAPASSVRIVWSDVASCM